MKSINKVKTLLEAVVVIAVALAFVMPVTAMTSQTQLVASFNEPKNVLGRGEWIAQASGFATASRGIRSLDAVDNLTAWAIAYDGSGGGAATTDFTMTTDGGNLWTANIVLGAEGYGLGNICGLSGTVAYAAVFNQAGAQDVACGAYKTTNGGSTWTQLGHYPISFCNNVIFWNENEGVVLGDTADGYFEDYYTSDGGVTWIRVPLANYSGLAAQSGEGGWTGVVDVVGDTVIFGTNLGNVYISQDRGHTYFASYSGASTGGLNGGVNDIAFKDGTHGLVAHDNGVTYDLFETMDGGVSWTPVTYSGTCFSSGLAYLPGTANKYVSTGAATGSSGASYSLDGGHSWTNYNAVIDQMLATDFVAGEIGWAGGFNTDETTGGMFKHIPSENPQPALTISVTGGKGFTVKINNIGEANATNVTCAITITGGLVIKPKDFSGSQLTLGIGQNFTIPCAPKGIGLGFLTPMPSIKIDVTCSEGVNATKIVAAKIFFSKVTL
ncbi:MAG: hypothetical protein IMZ58_03760 [Thermoplasmata archaeon]|nr:hypothetical protein [Thermoplasmata archaeon]